MVGTQDIMKRVGQIITEGAEAAIKKMMKVLKKKKASLRLSLSAVGITQGNIGVGLKVYAVENQE